MDQHFVARPRRRPALFGTIEPDEMTDYPRVDQRVSLRLTDGRGLTGKINIAGRTALDIAQDDEPELVLYDACDDEGKAFETVLVSKCHIVRIEEAGPPSGRPENGTWHLVRFRLTSGQQLDGDIEVTGIARTSDFFRAYPDRFYDVYTKGAADEPSRRVFIAASHVLWREPLS